jgi:hypothetical protein
MSLAQASLVWFKWSIYRPGLAHIDALDCTSVKIFWNKLRRRCRSVVENLLIALHQTSRTIDRLIFSFNLSKLPDGKVSNSVRVSLASGLSAFGTRTLSKISTQTCCACVNTARMLAQPQYTTEYSPTVLDDEDDLTRYKHVHRYFLRDVHRRVASVYARNHLAPNHLIDQW